MCGGIEDEGLKAMAAWRRAIELSLGDADVERLRSIAQSRTEPASRVERARIRLAYREDPSFFAVGRALGLRRHRGRAPRPCAGRLYYPDRCPRRGDRISQAQARRR